MIIPYRINNYPAANPCDFSDSIKQKDFFFSPISNIQFVYDKHRKETQPNARWRRTGKRGNVVRQANPYCSRAKKVPWPAAFQDGWRVSYLVKKLSVPTYCFLALHQNVSPLSIEMRPSFDSSHRSQTLGCTPVLALSLHSVTYSCVCYMYFGLM